MNRRDTVFALAALGAAPLASFAQQRPKAGARIGALFPGTPASFSLRTAAFLQGLRDLGYIEGQNITIEWMWAENQVEKLPALAAELVRANVELVVTNGTPAARALRQATRTIPIVMALVADPIGTGLAESLARPGGNITGLTDMAPELIMKRLEILKSIVPKATRVGLIFNPKNPNSLIEVKGAQDASRRAGIALHLFEVADASRLEDAFAAMTRAHVDAFVVLTDAILYSWRSRIVELAAQTRLPGMYPQPDTVEAGGLISYAPDSNDMFRRSASYVDKILRGAKPGELPIEQPTQYFMAVNAHTAKTLRLSVPRELLIRADRVIE